MTYALAAIVWRLQCCAEQMRKEQSVFGLVNPN